MTAQLITLKEYTKMCGLPVRTLRRFCQEGILPSMQIGRTYYIDIPTADKVLDDTINESTARKRAAPNVPELCRRQNGKKFDFLKALAEA